MQKLKLLFQKTISLEEKMFIWWRFLFGAYFIYYAVRTIPYLEEIYGREGIVPDISLNWTYGIFPNLFSFISTEQLPLLLHLGIIVSALFLLFGYFPRAAAFIIWFLQTTLYNRNVLTGEPSLAFVGLLLLTLTLIPNQPSLLRKREYREMEVPYFVFFLPVFIFCLTFTVSAIDKSMSSSWLSGKALMQMLNMGIIKDNFIVHFFISQPALVSAFSYLAVLVQFSCFPLMVLGFYRMALILNFLAFLCIFYLIDINQVIYGMLFFYSFFLLDVSFLRKIKQRLFS